MSRPVAIVVYLAFGTVFGFILSRSGAADYDFIQGMFLLEEFQLYGIIGTAVVVTAPGLWLLKRHGRTLTGQAIVVDRKPQHRGNLWGGILFGIGWSVTGMCPGPILVNIGEGKMYAIAAFAGVLVGASTFSVLYEKLAPLFRLPALQVGTGDG